MSEPTLTVDISGYDRFIDGRIEVYGSEAGTLAGLLGDSGLDVDKYVISAEKTGDNYEEDRFHHIRSRTGGGVRDSHTITRKTETNQIDPRIFEDMHPAVVLGGQYDSSTINLEMRDPTVMIPRDARIQDDREIYLRTPEGTGPTGNYLEGDNEIPDVEAFIRESENGTEYELMTGNGHMCAVGNIQGVNKEEHLNQILDTIDMPDWQTLLDQKRAQQV